MSRFFINRPIVAMVISIITVLDNIVPLMREHIRQQGINESLASIRVINISVHDLAEGKERNSF